MKTSSTWIIGILAAGVAIYIINKNDKRQQDILAAIPANRI